MYSSSFSAHENSSFHLETTDYTPEKTIDKEFITVKNVHKIYPTKGIENVVLEGVNLSVSEGEFICIIGHSGCGKSTLLNMVTGFVICYSFFGTGLSQRKVD